MVRVHPGLLKMDSGLQARYDAGVQFRQRWICKKRRLSLEFSKLNSVIENGQILQMTSNPPRYAKGQSDPA
jgi:hypothetical protein